MSENNRTKIGNDRRSVIEELLVKYVAPGMKILDLGAADGRCTKGFHHVTTIDIQGSPDMLADLEHGLPMLKNESYDITVAGDVIEHIYNTHILMPEVSRVLKPNGKLIITAPNVCQWRYRLAFMLGRIPSHAADGNKTHPRRGHIRDFNYAEMRRLLSRHGFRIAEEAGISTLLPRTLGHTVIMVGEKKKEGD